MTITTGSIAPDFELRSHRGGTVRLSDFRGKRNVLLAFHPLAFTPVCAAQMSSYESNFDRFEAVSTHVVGISPDASPSKAAWAQSLGGLSFDLLSDFYPHGEVAAKYGVLRPDGLAERAVFVIDRDGVVQYARKYDIPEHPDVEEVFRAIEKL